MAWLSLHWGLSLEGRTEFMLLFTQLLVLHETFRSFVSLLPLPHHQMGLKLVSLKWVRVGKEDSSRL